MSLVLVMISHDCGCTLSSERCGRIDKVPPGFNMEPVVVRHSYRGPAICCVHLATVGPAVSSLGDATLLPPLLVFGTKAGLRASVETMCEALPDTAAVIVHGESIVNLGAAIRSFCDVPDCRQ